MHSLLILLLSTSIAIQALSTSIPSLPPWSSYRYLQGLGMAAYPYSQEQETPPTQPVRDLRISMDTLTRILKDAQRTDGSQQSIKIQERPKINIEAKVDQPNVRAIPFLNASRNKAFYEPGKSLWNLL